MFIGIWEVFLEVQWLVHFGISKIITAYVGLINESGA